MRQGVRLGVDVGRARVGLARSDRDGLLATPVETVARDLKGSADIEHIVSVARDLDALEIIVGLPIALSGAHTASTQDALEFAERLVAAIDLPVRTVDERLSTVSAHAALRSAGRKTKTHRSVIDQVAAVIIVQHTLDAERATGIAPGALLAANEGL